MVTLTHTQKIDIAEKALRKVIAVNTVNGKCLLTESNLKEHAFIEAGNVFPKRIYLQPVIDELLRRVR